LISLADAANFAAGAGDTLTFGATKKIRGLIGSDGTDYCSTAYGAGGVAGMAVGMLVPGPGGLAALGRAAKGAEEATTLYRAVGPEELADIQKLGGYRVPSGRTEGKYFFSSPEQSSNFARMMGDQPYTTTSITVSRDSLMKGQTINPAREGPGYFFETPHVPSGPVTIFNHSMLP
jgi:hypothetical protein